MKTIIRRVEDIETGHDAIELAGQYLREGRLVAFPTETVYGLGANALDVDAITEIFHAKGRPMDNPLIVHIASVDELDKLVLHVPYAARILIDKYWPGPLTLVLPRSSIIPDEVTAGLGTVAIRMPSDPVAHALIKESKVPIAAPSANSSGKPSPTSAEHVIEDLYGKIPLILDGGECRVGLESTVLDMSGKSPVILRPGGITREMIERAIGEIGVDERVLKPPHAGDNFRSPGMKYTHYAPKAPVFIVKGHMEDVPSKIVDISKEHIKSGKKVAVLATEETKDRYEDEKLIVFVMGSRACPTTIASNLFAMLRQCDEEDVDLIVAESIDTSHEGLAIMNRMLRAAAFHVIDA